MQTYPCLSSARSGIHYPEFPSRFVQPRAVDVWTPPGYDPDGGQRHPVLYMHDGQNLFDPALSYAGVDWGVAEAAQRLAAQGKIAPPIIVGIWNTPLRSREYLPQKIYEVSSNPDYKNAVLDFAGGAPLSDSYLNFLVSELKPWVDCEFATLPEPRSTFLMGSSMGALVSLYGVLEYPDVFGGAGCLSTHFPIGGESLMIYLLGYLPNPGRHRFYFDHGTETLDREYGPYQERVDGIMQAAGYTAGQDWLTLQFAGAEHSERAWRERVHHPLRFLLGHS